MADCSRDLCRGSSRTNFDGDSYSVTMGFAFCQAGTFSLMDLIQKTSFDLSFERRLQVGCRREPQADSLAAIRIHEELAATNSPTILMSAVAVKATREWGSMKLHCAAASATFGADLVDRLDDVEIAPGQIGEWAARDGEADPIEARCFVDVLEPRAFARLPVAQVPAKDGGLPVGMFASAGVEDDWSADHRTCGGLEHGGGRRAVLGTFLMDGQLGDAAVILDVSRRDYR